MAMRKLKIERVSTLYGEGLKRVDDRDLFRIRDRIVEFEIYNWYEAVNLQYGLLAKRVGDALSQSNPNLLVLVE